MKKQHQRQFSVPLQLFVMRNVKANRNPILRWFLVGYREIANCLDRNVPQRQLGQLLTDRSYLGDVRPGHTVQVIPNCIYKIQCCLYLRSRFKAGVLMMQAIMWRNSLPGGGGITRPMPGRLWL